MSIACGFHGFDVVMTLCILGVKVLETLNAVSN